MLQEYIKAPITEFDNSEKHDVFVESEKNELEREKEIFGKILREYQFVLNTSLSHRYITLTIIVLLFAGCLALAFGYGFIFCNIHYPDPCPMHG